MVNFLLPRYMHGPGTLGSFIEGDEGNLSTMSTLLGEGQNLRMAELNRTGSRDMAEVADDVE